MTHSTLEVLKMRRQIIKWFLIWVCGCVIPIIGVNYFTSGFLPDTKFWQFVFLESLVFLNFIYLLIILKKIDSAFALGVVIVFWLANFISSRLFKEIDGRIQALQILAVLVVLNIIVNFIQRKSSPR